MDKIWLCSSSQLVWSAALLISCAVYNHGKMLTEKLSLFQSKKDDMLRYSVERIPFLEEQERKIKEGGKLLTMDIERLLLSEDNRYDFVNEIAAEATAYVKRNRNEYGGKKKAILHALSNRVNDLGFYRPDAYEETDPFKPGPTYIREEFT